MIIQPIGRNQYKVESITRPGSYYVVRLGDKRSCTCPSFEFSHERRWCKHISIVNGEMRKRQKEMEHKRDGIEKAGKY